MALKLASSNGITLDMILKSNNRDSGSGIAISRTGQSHSWACSSHMSKYPFYSGAQNPSTLQAVDDTSLLRHHRKIGLEYQSTPYFILEIATLGWHKYIKNLNAKSSALIQLISLPSKQMMISLAQLTLLFELLSQLRQKLASTLFKEMKTILIPILRSSSSAAGHISKDNSFYPDSSRLTSGIGPAFYYATSGWLLFILASWEALIRLIAEEEDSAEDEDLQESNGDEEIQKLFESRQEIEFGLLV
ncbi:hypothetical protein EV702DRAFT_1047720 [Suillus placidus]|uniref:Uncharacterized protein n=1 Tax=Suillus placidus TaxID=48579 RepID=A0A9P6ZQE3_9AGAM|nr:hypothetical protein EV702DRAFT_1047720 [Suillus placidus]